MTTSYSIAPLADYLDTITTIAGWFEDQWPVWYGADGPGDAMNDLQCWCQNDALPLALIALTDENLPVGIAALKANGLGEEHGLGPFLSAFYVHRDYRNKGVGSSLVSAMQTTAKALSFHTLYATTDTAKGLLTRCGWIDTGLVSMSERGELTLYRVDL